jgi:anthranilate phosphoribosyltransferase
VQMVCASAAVAMHCRGTVDSIRTGYDRSQTLLADGTVAGKFENFRSTCRTLAA